MQFFQNRQNEEQKILKYFENPNLDSIISKSKSSYRLWLLFLLLYNFIKHLGNLWNFWPFLEHCPQLRSKVFGDLKTFLGFVSSTIILAIFSESPKWRTTNLKYFKSLNLGSIISKSSHPTDFGFFSLIRYLPKQDNFLS